MLKYMTSISKDLCIDKLADIVDEYNNTYRRTINMKSVGVTSSIYIDTGVENNNKDPKFEVGDHVRILKYKNILAKDYTLSNWFYEYFVN